MNIILVISDTFRYDNLFDRASMPVRTPELDGFSRRAVSVSGMYTASFLHRQVGVRSPRRPRRA